MRYAIIGAHGQLGSALCDAVVAQGHEVLPIGHGRWTERDEPPWFCDVLYEDAVCDLLQKLQPDVVVNCAALHNVGQCDEMPMAAVHVNAEGARNVARAAKRIGALYIFISTDYVFGRINQLNCNGYSVNDVPAPLNVYGWSKAMGEFLASHEWERTAIVRIAYLFGKGGANQKGGNFVDRVISQLDREGQAERPDDIIVSPTYARDAASAILTIREPGVYHAVNCSWTSLYDFAARIAQRIGQANRVRPVKAVNEKICRPKFSALIPNLPTRPWSVALDAYLQEIGRLAA